MTMIAMIAVDALFAEWSSLAAAHLLALILPGESWRDSTGKH
jgi:hypothetical protein